MSGPTTVEQVVNQALDRIGYEDYVNNIYDGTRQARIALNIYSQTRDQLLRQNDWSFAERNVMLTLLKSAPAGGYIPPTTWTSAYPSPPWRFEYEHPADCLKVRAVKSVPLFLPNFDPQPTLFSVDNDNSYTPPKKVIMSNVADAMLVYTGQVTDPTNWEADFVEAVIAALAKRFAPGLGNLAKQQVEAQDEAVTKVIAETEQG